MFKEMFTGRRGRLRAYLFELAIALGYILIGIAWLTDPQTTGRYSAAGRAVYPYDIIWSVLYLIGGAAIIYGIVKPALRVRAAGLILLGTALVMQMIAVASAHLDARIGFYLIVACACFMRALLIWRVFRIYREMGHEPTVAL